MYLLPTRTWRNLEPVNVRTIIYEDNIRLRQSMEQLLQDGIGFRVVGSFPDCNDVVFHLDQLLPELVIMDIDMPGIGGIEGVRRIRSHSPEVKVIMHTVFDDDQRIFDSLCAGADGYLLKNTAPVRFIQALHDIMEGGAPMSPLIAQKVFQFFRKRDEPLNPDFGLTAREQEILELLVQGNSYKMIASLCSISLDTVRKHIKNIYHKLHVQCGTEAVAKAIKLKIVRLE